MKDRSWTDTEGAALCRATEEAFPAIALPEDDALVHDIRFDDMAQMAAACRGKTWRDLDGEVLFTTFRSFASLATDDGFCALLPAFLVQSVVADDDYRTELKGTVMAALDVSEYRGSREAWNTHLARTTRRVIMMTPEQRWVARAFLVPCNGTGTFGGFVPVRVNEVVYPNHETGVAMGGIRTSCLTGFR